MKITAEVKISGEIKSAILSTEISPDFTRATIAALCSEVCLVMPTYVSKKITGRLTLATTGRHGYLVTGWTFTVNNLKPLLRR